jgi:hypothetical protein
MQNKTVTFCHIKLKQVAQLPHPRLITQTNKQKNLD